jgi:uncharacterized membrane protein
MIPDRSYQLEGACVTFCSSCHVRPKRTNASSRSGFVLGIREPAFIDDGARRRKAELIMDDLAIVRVLHVLGVVIWIGGVGMVTAVVLPAKYSSAEERARVFEAVESRFAWIARAMTLLVGFSGLYMLWKLRLWDRFSDPSYWWMHAMVCVWAIFTFLLFVAEPLFLHRRFAQRARSAPEKTFRLAQRVHWILLLASLITIAGAVAGAHGYVLF